MTTSPPTKATPTQPPPQVDVPPTRPTVIKAAACHLSPRYLNPTLTTQKALTAITTAAAQGANLIAFPEAFFPGFPLYTSILAPIDHGTRFSEYVEASIYADGPEIHALREKAQELGVVVSMGFSERSRASVGCLWNSNVLIGEDGEVLSHHRKLMPTFFEKLVWSPGDGHGLSVSPTARAGKIGMLICGENTNPLARYSLMAQAEEVHVASYPPVWPTARPSESGGEGRGGYKNKLANGTRAASHSFEAKCFTILCAAFLSQENKEAIAKGDAEVMKVLEATPQAASGFWGPDAQQIGEKAEGEEKIVFATFDLGRCVEAKRLHDVVGGYQRFDVFDLKVNRRREEPVTWA